MTEIIKSLSSWIREKISSPLYFTFVLFYVVWNWKFFYFLFLEDALLLRRPRFEYIYHNLTIHLPLYDIPRWIQVILNYIAGFAWHLLPPLMFTYLAIVYLPRIHLWALNLHLKSHFDRKRVYDDALLTYQKEKTLQLEEKAKQKEKQEVAISRIERAQSQEDKWSEEFVAFSKNQENITALRQAQNIIYQFEGRYVARRNEAVSPNYINHESIALLDAHGVLRLKKEVNDVPRMELTDKGKHFVLKIQEQKNA